MDKIILSSADVETLLKWRDNNTELIRRNAAPFKGIMLDFPETHINIKAYNDGGKIVFYLYINGEKAGKIAGIQLPAGLFKETKNTTKLNKEDKQSIITVYASLMAFIVYNKPEAAAMAADAPHQRKPHTKKSGAQRSKKGTTYIFNKHSTGPRIQARGHHASPAGVFSVRGHYRHYKNGKTVWIKPYSKGTGGHKDKTYKLK